MDKRSSCANCGSLDHLVSAFSIYKQSLKAIGFFLDDVDATNEDHEDYVKRILLKYEPRCFLATLKGISNQTALSFRMQYQTQRTPATKRRLSGVKASRANLMNEAESRKKELSQGTFATKYVRKLSDYAVVSNLEVIPANTLRMDLSIVSPTALRKVQQKIATKEVDNGWSLNWKKNRNVRETGNLGEDRENRRKRDN